MDMKTLYSQLNIAITHYNLAVRRGSELSLAWGMRAQHYASQVGAKLVNMPSGRVGAITADVFLPMLPIDD